MEFLTVIKSGSVAIILGACSYPQSPEKKSEQTGQSQVPEPKIIKKPPSSFDDTVIVSSRSAVFYNPDSLQLRKICLVNEKRVYATITHDCYYQMQNARNVIRRYWPNIRIVEVVDARYLLFIKKDKNKRFIDLDAKNNICGLFLFDPKKDPELVDMPNIDSFLWFYFGGDEKIELTNKQKNKS
jgi:hypothetical protein